MSTLRHHAASLTVFAALIAFVALPVGALAANPADLDPGFGVNGLATSPSSETEMVKGVTVLPDGRVAWGGWGYSPAAVNHGFMLGRLTSSGAPDPTFGNSVGNVSHSHFGTEINYGNAFLVRPDGSMVVAGTHGSNDPTGLIAGYTASGQLDLAGFASPTGWRNQAGTLGFDINGLGLQPGGKIIAAGSTGAFSSADDFMIWRLTSSGDNDFTLPGGVTYLHTDFLGDVDQARDIVVLSDGGFALAGSANAPSPGPRYLAVAKYLASGAMDPSFSGDGKVVTAIGDAPIGQAIVAQPDGKLLVAASIGSPGARSSVLVRYTPSGDLDQSFGAGGISTTPFDGKVGANALALQPDGKIVVTASISLAPSVVVGRFLPNGLVDTGFGASGYAALNLSPGTDHAYDVAVQPDGKIVLGGSVNPLNSIQSDDWAVVRLRGGEPTAEAPPPVPISKITSPSKKSLKRKKFKKISGTAGPAGSIAKVEIAVRRIDAKSLKKKRCVWLKNNKAKFKKNKSTAKKKCTKQVWLKAKGTSKWSYSLKKKRYLTKGSYEIFSRVTLTNGTKQTTFSTRAGNFKKLKLK